MNENLDLVEILKDCPSGVEFYSPMCGKITFNRINEKSTLRPIETNIYTFTTDGKYNPNGECMLFPSKGQRDWSKWHRPFVDGDVVIYINRDNTKSMFIYKEVTLERKGYYSYCWFNEIYGVKVEAQYVGVLDNTVVRLATEEEKQKLFDVIKKKGYKWNADTKTLEKLIVPKFKVGDKIKHKDTVLTIITVRTDSYIIEDDPGNFGILMVSQQDNWELINEPKFKVGDRIRYAGEDFPIKIIDIKNNQYHIECFYDKYNDYKNGIIPVSEQNNYMLIPKFNPKTLQPFDRVLVSCNDEWFCDFFSHYDDAVNKFNCTCTGGCPYEYCIPYNDDTKHLIGKSIEDTPEFYRHWEE